MFSAFLVLNAYQITVKDRIRTELRPYTLKRILENFAIIGWDSLKSFNFYVIQVK